MAIISCSECQAAISDQASSCPQCGAPVGRKSRGHAARGRTHTVEQTGKKWKMQFLLATICIIAGVCMMVSGAGGNEDQVKTAAVGFLLVIAGFFWLIIARVLAWWNHG